MPDDDKSSNNPQLNKFWIFPANRGFAAYLLMTLFVTCSSVGAALIYFPAGLITFGMTCGLYAYLLGSD